MFFVWRCARARMPLLTGFWAAITVGSAQTASSMVPSVDLILESPVKGVLAAAEFCIGKALPSRLEFGGRQQDRKSTRLNSSHVAISYSDFCLKEKTND